MAVGVNLSQTSKGRVAVHRTTRIDPVHVSTVRIIQHEGRRGGWSSHKAVEIYLERIWRILWGSRFLSPEQFRDIPSSRRELRTEQSKQLQMIASFLDACFLWASSFLELSQTYAEMRSHQEGRSKIEHPGNFNGINKPLSLSPPDCQHKNSTERSPRRSAQQTRRQLEDVPAVGQEPSS